MRCLKSGSSLGSRENAIRIGKLPKVGLLLMHLFVQSSTVFAAYVLIRYERFSKAGFSTKQQSNFMSRIG